MKQLSGLYARTFFTFRTALVYTLKETVNAVTSYTISWNSQVTEMMAEVSDVTWKNREETREACTVMETHSVVSNNRR